MSIFTMKNVPGRFWVWDFSLMIIILLILSSCDPGNEISDSNPTIGSDGYIFLESYSDLTPDWSNDGSKITFVSNRDGDHDIYIMDSDGSNLINATADINPSLIQMLFMIRKTNDMTPTWSPDGKMIAFSSSRDNFLMSQEYFNIMIMDVQDLQVNSLTEGIVTDTFPDWSPAGDQLVYGSNNVNSYDIFNINSDGTDAYSMILQPCDKCENWYSRWSPDGEWIAFNSDRDGNIEIYIMNPEGKDVRRLTNDPGEDSMPSWSPNREQLAFVSNRDGDFEIYTMDIDGSNIHQITDNDVFDLYPAWSPDGNKIAFSHDVNEGRRIFVINVDGTNLQQLTGGPIEVPPIENSIYYLNKGVFNINRYLSEHEGSYEDAFEPLDKAISMNNRLAEAYLARGLALLLRCRINWGHKLGLEVQVYDRNDSCVDFNAALDDLETAIELGLDPEVQKSTESLYSKLKQP